MVSDNRESPDTETVRTNLRLDTTGCGDKQDFQDRDQ